jgi:hypothetical protein
MFSFPIIIFFFVPLPAYFCDLAAADYHAIRTGCAGSAGRAVSVVFPAGIGWLMLNTLLPCTFWPALP